MDKFVKNFKDAENIQTFLDSEDSLENTPLLLAAERGFASIVEKLLNNKANIKKSNLKGKNALQIAMDAGHKKVIETILNSTAWKDSLR